MSNPLEDMEKPDVIFCIGTNMTECHPVAATRLKRAIANGAKLITADPRRIGLAELADVYLPLRVGSDVSLLLAMAHVIHREGLIDKGFVEGRTTEAEAFLDHIEEFTPEWPSPSPRCPRPTSNAPPCSTERPSAAPSTTPSASPSTSAASTTSRASATWRS